jgi:hypothetical protein
VVPVIGDAELMLVYGSKHRLPGLANLLRHVGKPTPPPLDGQRRPYQRRAGIRETWSYGDTDAVQRGVLPPEGRIELSTAYDVPGGPC